MFASVSPIYKLVCWEFIPKVSIQKSVQISYRWYCCWNVTGEECKQREEKFYDPRKFKKYLFAENYYNFFILYISRDFGLVEN